MRRNLEPLAMLVLSIGVSGASPGAWAAGAPRASLRLPADRVFNDSPDAPAPATFRHTTHVVLAKWRCLACHPLPFKMLTRELRPSHAEMDAGHQCGLCHDGRRAFATSDGDACESCHGAPASGDPFAKPIILAHPQAPAPVVFPHARHAAVLGRCSDCHPGLFQRQVSGRRYTKQALVVGQACGKCHNGKQAISVEDERCERCHKEDPP